MKRIRSRFLPLSVLFLIAAASIPNNHAQTVSVVKVLSNPDGPWFYVDGTLYYHAMSAFWPGGSVHTLYAPSGSGYAVNPDGTIQWQFQGWQWSGGTLSGNPVQVQASPSITQYTAVYSTQVLFTLQVSCNPAPCTGAPGVVQIGGATTSTNISQWVSPNTSLTLQAVPNPGWIFAGWQPGPGQTIIGFQNTVNIVAPMTINAVFLPATPVNITTVPPGLQVYADRELLSTPATMQWGQGTTHALGGINLTQDIHAKYWVFSSWSDGGAANHNYLVANNAQPENIAATYAAAVSPVFLTFPPNLNLVVDNQVLPPPYSYIWGVGSTHTVSAPTTQTDAQGTTWTFKSWDDNVTTPTRTFTIPASADGDGFRMLALYAAQSQAKLNVTSALPGLTVSVDGTPCVTPCTVQRDIGTQVHVSAPASVLAGPGSRQDFLGWSTGGALSSGDWVATLNASTTNLTASYHLMNQLTATASPSGGAHWQIQPASPDGFYDAQASVNVGVTPMPGFRFSNWGGDLSGSATTAALTMNAPHSVVAQFNPVPYIAPSGLMNAVGPVPQHGVAPGSVASIFGINLAAATAIGPASPMVQTLAGVTAHVGDRMLPLYFASPSQINLQIPPDLALGAQTLTLSSPGMPDASTDFTVLRNAPGLFALVIDGQTYALVLHQDGSLVTPDSPAQKGETLTAYATGLGPTIQLPEAGVVVPDGPPNMVMDPVTMQVGAKAYTPQVAVAAPGMVGLNLIQFQLDSAAPSGTAISFSLSVNGVNSNTLNLPIQ